MYIRNCGVAAELNGRNRGAAFEVDTIGEQVTQTRIYREGDETSDEDTMVCHVAEIPSAGVLRMPDTTITIRLSVVNNGVGSFYFVVYYNVQTSREPSRMAGPGCK